MNSHEYNVADIEQLEKRRFELRQAGGEESLGPWISQVIYRAD